MFSSTASFASRPCLRVFPSRIYPYILVFVQVNLIVLKVVTEVGFFSFMFSFLPSFLPFYLPTSGFQLSFFHVCSCFQAFCFLSSSNFLFLFSYFLFFSSVFCKRQHVETQKILFLFIWLP